MSVLLRTRYDFREFFVPEQKLGVIIDRTLKQNHSKDAMLRSQLVRLLLTLTPKELKQFHKYLNSPYFNTHQDTIRFLDLLISLFPNFTQENVEAQTIFHQLFPGKPFKDETLRTLRKYLLSHLKDFLALHAWQQDNKSRQLYLLKSLEKKSSAEDFVKEFKKSKSVIAKEPREDADYFLFEYQLGIRWLTFENTQGKRKQAPNLQPLVASLENFYMAEKLQLLSSELGNQQIMKAEPSHFFHKEEILNHVGQHFDHLPLLIQAYYLACNILQDRENAEPKFLQLRSILSEHAADFLPKELLNLYRYALRFANQEYLFGEVEYLLAMFELYNEMLELGLLFEGDSLPVNHYKNLTTLGLRLEDLEWSERFIETYKSSLMEEEAEAEAVYHYNLAHLRIYQKRYSEALQLLQTVIFLDSFYQLGTKMLQLKIFYEQEEVEMFFSLAKTFHTHITRQKNIPTSRQKAFLNFIKLTKSIFRIKIGEKSDHASLKTQIEQTIPLIEKEWILRKLEEVASPPIH